MEFVKNPLNATTPREIIEYSQDLEDRTEEAFEDVDGITAALSSDVNTLNNFKNDVADYVVDFGENANGKWEKWKSGKLEQWGSYIGPVANSVNTSFPIPFINNQIEIIVTNKYVAGEGETSRYTYSAFTSPSTVTSYVRDVNTGVAPTIGNCSFSYIAIGRWK